MNRNNPPEKIDPVDLISANYEAIEMSDASRQNILNTTRAVVAARRKMPMIRWATGLAGVAALIAVFALCWHVPPINKGAGQARFGNTPPHGTQPRVATGHGGSNDTKRAPKKTPLQTNKVAMRPVAKTNMPHAAPKATLWLGAKIVVVVQVQQPVTDGAGKALSVGDRVRSGDTVRTGKGGRVALVTRKGSELNLDSNSSLTLTSSTVATIQRGRLYCSNRDKEIARIDTPAGRVKLLGTVVDTNVLRQDTVAVTVVKGRVQLSNRYGNALVDAGKRSVLVAFRPPQAGTVVDTYKETSWYHGRGDYQSDFGDVAYTVQRGNGLMTEVWSVKADGTGRDRVRSFIGRADSAGWIPGERWLQVGVRSVIEFPDDKAGTAGWHSGASVFRGGELLLDVATGQTAPFALPDGYESLYRSLAPDPSIMAFNGYYQPDPSDPTNMDQGVWVYDSRNGSTKHVLKGSIKTAAAWAPDGRHIAISKGEDYTENHSLVIVDTVTGEVRDLGINGAGASFSPDGTKLAYSAEFTGHGSWWAGVPTSGSIFVLDLVSGGKPVRISSGEGGAIMPRWSPDGSRILYVQEDCVYISAADGSGRKQAYKGNGVFGPPSWAPNGDAIYLTIAIKGGFQTLLVAADGSGTIRTLSQSAADSRLPDDMQAQTDAAAAAIRGAVFEYAMGKTLSFEGDLAALEHYTAAADTFGGLVWNHPLSGLRADDTLVYADLAQRKASRTAAGMLHDTCNERMRFLALILGMDVAKHKQFPADLQSLTSSVSGGRRSGDSMASNSAAHMMLLWTCPGKGSRGPTPYLYMPPAPGTEPKVGAVIVRCPLHPDDCVRWDGQMTSRINTTLIDRADPGAWCCLGNNAYLSGSDGQMEFNLGIPYRFENVGSGPLTIIHHVLSDTYEIKGVAKLLPIDRIYKNETIKIGTLDEGSVARAIDAAGKLNWGGLPKDEIDRAQGELDFCRAVAQFEAGQPITFAKVIDGEPARPLHLDPSGRWYRSFGSGIYINPTGPEKTEVYQLVPSGRFRVYGTVKARGDELCKNGWLDKDAKVVFTEK